MGNTGGLNAGLNSGIMNVEPEDVFENFEPGETPDLREDVKIIAAIQSSAQDLDYLRSDILTTGGMTQHFAMEAQRLVPGFGGGVPIGFYTEGPSATRYRLSLEELEKTTWGIIAAAAAAVIAAIWKIVQWLRGRKDGKDGDFDDAVSDTKKVIEKTQANLEAGKDATKESATEVKEAVSEVEGRSEYVYKDADGKEKPLRNMEDAINDLFKDTDKLERIDKFLESKDPLFHDIVTNGPYVNAIKGMAPVMRALTGLLTARVANLKSIMKRDMGNGEQSAQAINNRELTGVGGPIMLSFNGSQRKLSEVAHALSELRSQVRSQTTHKKMAFDEVFNAINRAYDQSQLDRTLQDMNACTTVLAELEATLEDMKQVSGDQSTDGNAGNLTGGVGSDIREAIFQTGADVAAYGLLVSEIKVYANYMQYITRVATGMGADVARKVVSSVRGEDGKAPPAWVRLADGLSKRLKNLTAAYHDRS